MSGRSRRARVLEHDDPPDQVDAGSMRLLRDLARVVVVLRSADLARERHGGTDEADLAVLVLDVELDRVQPAAFEREVRVELSGERGERGRHVDAADLLRRLRRGRRRQRCRPSLAAPTAPPAEPRVVAGDEACVHRERNDPADEEDKDRQPAEAPPPPGLPSALAKLVARIDATRKDGRIVMHSETLHAKADDRCFASGCGQRLACGLRGSSGVQASGSCLTCPGLT